MEPVSEWIMDNDAELSAYARHVRWDVILGNLATIATGYADYPVRYHELKWDVMQEIARSGHMTRTAWIKKMVKVDEKPEPDTFANVFENEKVFNKLAVGLKDLLVRLIIKETHSPNWATHVRGQLVKDEQMFSAATGLTKSAGFPRNMIVTGAGLKPSAIQPLALPGVTCASVTAVIDAMLRFDEFRFGSEIFDVTGYIQRGKETGSSLALIEMLDGVRGFGVAYLLSALRLLTAPGHALLDQELAYVRERRDVSADALKLVDQTLSDWRSLPCHPFASLVESVARGARAEGRFGVLPLRLLPHDLTWDPVGRARGAVGLAAQLLSAESLLTDHSVWGAWTSDVTGNEVDWFTGSSATNKGEALHQRVRNYNLITLLTAYQRDPNLQQVVEKAANQLGWTRPEFGPMQYSLASAEFTRSDGLSYSKDPSPALLGLSAIVDTGEPKAMRFEADYERASNLPKKEIYTGYISAVSKASGATLPLDRRVVTLGMINAEGYRIISTASTPVGSFAAEVVQYYADRASAYLNNFTYNTFVEVSDGDARNYVHDWGLEVYVPAADGPRAVRVLVAANGEANSERMSAAKDLLYATRDEGFLKREIIRIAWSNDKYYVYDQLGQKLSKEYTVAAQVAFNNVIDVGVSDSEFARKVSALLPGTGGGA